MREHSVKDSLDHVRKLKPGGGDPEVARSLAVFPEFRAARVEFEERLKVLLADLEAKVKAKELTADSVLAELVEVSTVIEVTVDIEDSATRRVERGNPPGKKGSIGDALNWECLLSAGPNDVDLHIVTRDLDFASALDKERMSDFLADEWKETKGGSVLLHARLSEFFKESFPEIELALDLERAMAVQRLVRSGTFGRTHFAIEQLSGFDEFTDAESNDLVEAAIVNPQINWIRGDEDVRTFFVDFVIRKASVLDRGLLERVCDEFEIPPEDLQT